LFLDTPAFVAHTTGSDALWAGLPFVTIAGDESCGDCDCDDDRDDVAVPSTSSSPTMSPNQTTSRF
jgi:hypothetical protein